MQVCILEARKFFNLVCLRITGLRLFKELLVLGNYYNHWHAEVAIQSSRHIRGKVYGVLNLYKCFFN